MKALVVGGDGLLGRTLVNALVDAEVDVIKTTRREQDIQGAIFLDLAAPIPELPHRDVVFLVAAVASTIACEADRRGTWRVNVDAPLAIARRYVGEADIVFVSSDAVEFCGHMEYGRQKAHVEAALAFVPRTKIVRLSRITPETVGDAAEFIRLVGMSAGLEGLFRWPPVQGERALSRRKFGVDEICRHFEIPPR